MTRVIKLNFPFFFPFHSSQDALTPEDKCFIRSTNGCWHALDKVVTTGCHLFLFTAERQN